MSLRLARPPWHVLYNSNCQDGEAGGQPRHRRKLVPWLQAIGALDEVRLTKCRTLRYTGVLDRRFPTYLPSEALVYLWCFPIPREAAKLLRALTPTLHCARMESKLLFGCLAVTIQDTRARAGANATRPSWPARAFFSVYQLGTNLGP